jgi:hypothetical protein
MWPLAGPGSGCAPYVRAGISGATRSQPTSGVCTPSRRDPRFEGAVFRSGSVGWVRMVSWLAGKRFDQMVGELKA